jgi:hypothetical protein
MAETVTTQPVGGPAAWGAVPDEDHPATWGAVPDEGPSVAGDVAKSAGIGLVKGGIGLAGLPGDVNDLMARGGEWLGNKLGLPPLPAGTKFSPNIPTSQSIQSGVEDVTGKFYQPQTTAGKYAQTIGEFAPAVFSGPGGLLRKTAQTVIPGAASEAAGEATEGTALEPWARAGAGIVGGLGAGLTTRASTVEQAIRGQMPDYVTPGVINQADHLIADAGSRGVTLTWPEALSQVTGRPVLTDMQRLLESSRQTRGMMQDALSNRPQQMQAAGRGAADTIAPPTTAPATIGPEAGKAAKETVGDVRGAINRFTDPMYKRAETVQLTPQEMAQVRALPGYAEAADAVRSDTQLNRYVAHLPENSVGFLNEVKKQLDQQGRNATPRIGAQNPNMQRAAGLGQDAGALGTTLSNASPDYATAVAVQAHARQQFLDPLLQGPLGKLAKNDVTTQKAIDALFPANPLIGSEGEVSTAVSALAQRRPAAAQALVRAHVEQKLDEAFNAAGRGQEAAQFAGASAANRLAGSSVVPTQKFENFRAAVEALPGGKQTWPGIQRFLDIAQATGTRQPIGSKTAFNEKDLAALSHGGAAGNIAALATSPGEWWHYAHDAWGRWQLGSNLDGLAKLITDPKAAPIFERIARSPPNSREGQILAARLALQSGSEAGARSNDARQ